MFLVQRELLGLAVNTDERALLVDSISTSTFDALKQAIFDNFQYDLTPSGPFNPFSNTSLTQQINQEMRDLKNVAGLLDQTSSLSPQEKFKLLAERLAVTFVSIEEESKEAGVFAGSRLKAIKEMRDKLNGDSGLMFDEYVQQLRRALYEAKYKKPDIGLGIQVNYKALIHPVQNLMDGRVNRATVLKTDLMVCINSINGLMNVPMTQWAVEKYKKIDASIPERIKIKLFLLAAVATVWGLHHTIAHAIDAAMTHAKAAAGHHGVGLGSTGLDLPTPAPAPGTATAGHGIATAIEGGFTALVGCVGALLKGCEDANCSDLCKCDCGGCADCLSGCSDGLGSLCNSITNCLGQIASCELASCHMLETLSSCLGHLCESFANCCCAPTPQIGSLYYNSSTNNNCCFWDVNYYSTSTSRGNNYSVIGSGDDNGSSCCDFSRKPHSDRMLAAQIQARYSLSMV